MWKCGAVTSSSLCRERATGSRISSERTVQGLLAKDIVNKNDPRIQMTAAEFLAKAWKLANDKARELGWIV
jgi:hypothetical protein